MRLLAWRTIHPGRSAAQHARLSPSHSLAPPSTLLLLGLALLCAALASCGATRALRGGELEVYVEPRDAAVFVVVEVYDPQGEVIEEVDGVYDGSSRVSMSAVERGYYVVVAATRYKPGVTELYKRERQRALDELSTPGEEQKLAFGDVCAASVWVSGDTEVTSAAVVPAQSGGCRLVVQRAAEG